MQVNAHAQPHQQFTKFPSPTGQYFSNQNCDLKGVERFETFNVKKGKLVTDLKASEALIVYL